MSAKKFTFKKGKREKGLAAVASGTPDITILLNGKDVGFIKHNDGPLQNKEAGIVAYIRVERKPTPECSCNWRWAAIKQKFESSEAATTYLNENFELLSNLVFFTDEQRGQA
jgi:hypothetical protein